MSPGSGERRIKEKVTLYIKLGGILKGDREPSQCLLDKMMRVKDGEYQICLCHYPIVEWNGYFHGAYHIYGHIHNGKNEAFEIMKKKDHVLNAGCMINNYTPASFRELVRNNEIFKNSEDMSKERIGE